MRSINEAILSLKKIPFVDQFNVNVSEINLGKAILSLAPQNKLMNHFELFQAGVLFTMAEISAGFACATIFPTENHLILTRSCKIDFLGATNKSFSCAAHILGDYKEVQTISIGKTLVEASSEAIDESGIKLISAKFYFYVRKANQKIFERMNRK